MLRHKNFSCAGSHVILFTRCYVVWEVSRCNVWNAEARLKKVRNAARVVENHRKPIPSETLKGNFEVLMMSSSEEITKTEHKKRHEGTWKPFKNTRPPWVVSSPCSRWRTITHTRILKDVQVFDRLLRRVLMHWDFWILLRPPMHLLQICAHCRPDIACDSSMFWISEESIRSQSRAKRGHHEQ